MASEAWRLGVNCFHRAPNGPWIEGRGIAGDGGGAEHGARDRPDTGARARAWAVMGVPDEAKGEISKACAVLKPGAMTSAAGLEAHCRQNVVPSKVPRLIECLDKVPKTASAKPQRVLRLQGSV